MPTYFIRNTKMVCALHVPGQARPIEIGSDWVPVDATTYQGMGTEKAGNRGFERRIEDNNTPAASAEIPRPRKLKETFGGD